MKIILSVLLFLIISNFSLAQKAKRVEFNELDKVQLNQVIRVRIALFEMKKGDLEKLKELVNLEELEIVENDSTSTINLIDFIPDLERNIKPLQALKIVSLQFDSIQNLSLNWLNNATLKNILIRGKWCQNLELTQRSTFELNGLHFYFNGMNTLPNWIYQQKKLQKIELELPDLENISEEIGTLIELSKLSITSDKLKELPIHLGYCKKLKTIKLYTPVLKNIDVLKPINSLESFYLRSIYVSSLKPLNKNKSMKNLNIEGTQQLKKINLKKLHIHELKTFELVGNYGLKKIKGLARNTQLQHLVFSDVNPKNWIKSIQSLKELKTLALRYSDYLNIKKKWYNKLNALRINVYLSSNYLKIENEKFLELNDVTLDAEKELFRMNIPYQSK